MKHLLKIVSAIVVVCFFYFTGSVVLAQTDPQKSYNIDSTFSDSKFASWIKSNLDSNKDGSLSYDEYSSVSSIDVESKQIKSLEGIEIFENLTTLSCSCNELSGLDVSANTSLENLYCSYNDIKELKLGNNTALKNLICSRNKLTELDISGNASLQNLICSTNDISNIYMVDNLKLNYLDCSGNDLSTLNLRTAPNLKTVVCVNSNLSALYVSKCTSLKKLDCSKNNLTYLNVSKNQSLTDLDCSENALSGMNVKNLSSLEKLNCSDNELENLDVSSDTALLNLNCSNNLLTDLNLSNAGDIRDLNCERNQLADLDVSECTLLGTLDCSANYLTTIDLNSNICLVDLDVSWNKIAKLNLGKNDSLQKINLFNNELTELDISKNVWLEELNCSNSNISLLDTSKNTKLTSLSCSYNPIKELDVCQNIGLKILNCEGTEISELNISNNSILVDAYKKIGFSEYSFNRDAYICSDNGVQLIIPKTTKLITEAPASNNQNPATPSSGGSTSVPDAPSTPSSTPTSSSSSSTTQQGLSFGDFVERLYVVALNRQSEPEGKAFWCEHVGNGDLNGAQCANEFLLSKEFNDRGLSDEEFLNVLYKTFFDRDAANDPDGFNFWMNSLKTEGRDKVVDGFINSEEWCNICASYGVKSGATRAKATIASANATAFATRLYTECLGREPEAEGLKFWSLGLTNLELSGTQAAREFFYSPEFVNANYSDEEYINRMYKTFMGRDPEPEGKAYWLDLLSKGTSRDEVFNFFSTCPEFTGICNEYAITR